jgi:hypothetical protein
MTNKAKIPDRVLFIVCSSTNSFIFEDGASVTIKFAELVQIWWKFV